MDALQKIGVLYGLIYFTVEVFKDAIAAGKTNWTRVGIFVAGAGFGFFFDTSMFELLGLAPTVYEWFNIAFNLFFMGIFAVGGTGKLHDFLNNVAPKTAVMPHTKTDVP